MSKKDKTLYKKSRYIGLCLQKLTCRDFGTPDRNRTYAPGSGGRCSIHWATGAYEMVQFSISHFFQKAKHFFEKVKKLFSKKSLTFPVMDDIIAYVDTNRHLKMWYAGMAELADALDSGSNGRKAVQVQVLLPAPKIDRPHMLLVDFISLPTRNRQVSLRLGHAPALSLQAVIQKYCTLHLLADA